MTPEEAKVFKVGNYVTWISSDGEIKNGDVLKIHLLSSDGYFFRVQPITKRPGTLPGWDAFWRNWWAPSLDCFRLSTDEEIQKAQTSQAPGDKKDLLHEAMMSSAPPLPFSILEDETPKIAEVIARAHAKASRGADSSVLLDLPWGLFGFLSICLAGLSLFTWITWLDHIERLARIAAGCK